MHNQVAIKFLHCPHEYSFELQIHSIFGSKIAPSTFLSSGGIPDDFNFIFISSQAFYCSTTYSFLFTFFLRSPKITHPASFSLISCSHHFFKIILCSSFKFLNRDRAMNPHTIHCIAIVAISMTMLSIVSFHLLLSY